MGKNNLYTIKSTSDSTYSVAKFDSDLMLDGELYHVSEIGPGGANMVCTCPAGGRPACRHRQMLRLFQAENRVNSGWFYHFDKKQWVKPISED